MSDPMLSLLEEGNPLLEQVCEPWDFDQDGDPTELVKDMFAALVDYGGIGLAAPQCGIMKNIFVMGNFKKMTACINPAIIDTSSDKTVDVEGCLSFPGLWLKVRRPVAVKVQYQDIEGNIVNSEMDGLEARVFLHEYDHLYGLTFDMRVRNLSLKMAKDKRTKSIKKLMRNTKKG